MSIATPKNMANALFITWNFDSKIENYVVGYSFHIASREDLRAHKLIANALFALWNLILE